MPPYSSLETRAPAASLRLLIVRLGAMGDVLHALPAVTALRAALPQASLGWAVEPRWAPLLRAGDEAAPRSAGMPLLDAVHTAGARGWARAPLAWRTWSSIRRLRTELREMRYDVAIDLQGALRSAALARLCGAARVVGEAEPREAPARLLFTERAPTRGVHVIEQAVEVVSAAVGLDLEWQAPILPREEAAEQRIASLAGSGDALAVLNPGAGWGAKRWPAECYGAVARSLAAAGFCVVVNAGPGERPIAEAVIQASGARAVLLEAGLSELIALMRRAALCVAGDTGPLHLASALGVPTVGIFGPTDPARNGPFRGRYRTLRHPESKRDHTRRRDPEAGLLTITPDEVLAAVEAVSAHEARS